MGSEILLLRLVGMARGRGKGRGWGCAIVNEDVEVLSWGEVASGSDWISASTTAVQLGNRIRSIGSRQDNNKWGKKTRGRRSVWVEGFLVSVPVM